MFDGLGKVLLEVGHDVGHLLTVIVGELVGIVVDNVCQVVEQFGRHFAEVDDEVQRVLYLVCNACAEHAQRGQLFLLLQLLLEGSYFLFVHIRSVLKGWQCDGEFCILVFFRLDGDGATVVLHDFVA